MSENEMNVNHANLLIKLEGGADIFSRKEAELCRQIKAIRPDYITIVKAVNNYDGAGKLPYFGAVSTKAGLYWARRVPGNYMDIMRHQYDKRVSQ